MSRLKDADAASEVFSTFTEDLWRTMGSFGARCSARTWCYVLARHAASRYVKGAQRERKSRVPLSTLSALSRIEQEIRQETLPILKSEVRRGLAALRERLSAADQELLMLRVNRGLDWREIARIMLDDESRSSDDAALAREAGRLRKRFQLVKAQLRKLAQAEGLLNEDCIDAGEE